MAGGAEAVGVNTAQASSARTLVVEDDPHLAAGLAENLRAEGYAVETAADGKLALSWLRENSC
jgi:DNA-binding response OmpR family regulator